MTYRFIVGLSVFFIMAAHALADLPRESFGLLKNTPLYVQEWHLWWGFPYPDRQRPVSHISSTLTSDREPWRLQWNRNGYPYCGLYDSANRDIIRWQIRCMKNAGFDATCAMIHPEWSKGLDYIQEESPNMVQSVLDIAAEEKYPVFFMDEVAFRKGSPAQKMDVMAERVARFIQKYGNHPGFYKIDGRPVFYFQTFGMTISAQELTALIRQVEAKAGKIAWMILGDVNRFAAVPGLSHIVCGSDLHRQNPETRKLDLLNQSAKRIFETAHAAHKKVGDIHYPKFDGTSPNWRQTGVWAYGLQRRRLDEMLKHSMQYQPDFLMFSSWNDYEEGAGIEPAWDFDGFTDDPFTYCRAVAHWKGKTFTPPPVPPAAALHPTIHEKLGYGDHAGPIIADVQRSHERGGSLAVTVRDSASEVDALEVVYDGDLFWKAPQQPERLDATGKLKSAQPLPASQRLRNAFDFSPGCATALPPGAVTFHAPELATFSDALTLAVATEFQPENPLAKLTVTVDNRTPVPAMEPKGAVRRQYTFDLTPHTHTAAFTTTLWNGWRTTVAIAPRPLHLSKGLTVYAPEQNVGLISILGAPQAGRTHTDGKRTSVDSPREKRFSFPLPDSILNTPGAHFVWLRGRDRAGNWGSPILYAVPNYEKFDRGKDVQQETAWNLPGAALSVNTTDLKRWRQVPAGTLKLYADAKRQPHYIIGNGMATIPLAHPAAGNFEVGIDLIHQHYRRLFTLRLSDRTLSRGIGFAFDSALPELASGTGFASIRAFTGTPDWNNVGKSLAQGASGHNAVGRQSTHFLLRYRSAERRLTLLANGKKIAETTLAAPLPPLTELTVRGNNSQLFNRVHVMNQSGEN